MAIKRWNPPVDPNQRELLILKMCAKKRRLFAFLRENRHLIFNERVGIIKAPSHIVSQLFKFT